MVQLATENSFFFRMMLRGVVCFDSDLKPEMCIKIKHKDYSTYKGLKTFNKIDLLISYTQLAKFSKTIIII